MHVVKMIFSEVDYKCLSVVVLPVAFFFLAAFLHRKWANRHLTIWTCIEL